MADRLFISHASEDEAVVNRIVAYLEANGRPCWLSSRDIPPQSIYADAIAEGMEACSACVVVLSAASNQSKAVKRELELASHYDKPFIPIRIDATEPGRGFDYYLRNAQWLDYRRDGERALGRLIEKPASTSTNTPPSIHPRLRETAPQSEAESASQASQIAGRSRSALRNTLTAAVAVLAAVAWVLRPRENSAGAEYEKSAITSTTSPPLESRGTTSHRPQHTSLEATNRARVQPPPRDSGTEQEISQQAPATPVSSTAWVVGDWQSATGNTTFVSTFRADGTCMIGEACDWTADGDNVHVRYRSGSTRWAVEFTRDGQILRGRELYANGRLSDVWILRRG